MFYIGISDKILAGPSLFVMCGLQCSGKSTIAKEIMEKYNAAIISSDDFRKMFPDEDNSKIFSRIYDRVNSTLRQNINVIIDATNTTIKMRKQIFSNVREPCVKYCIIVNTNYNECVDRLKARNASDYEPKVPLEVLEKYYQSFEIPFYEEGWNDIIVINKPEARDTFFTLNRLRDACAGFDQKNKHHTQDLGQHMFAVATYIEKNFTGPDKLILMEAAQYHDVGKLFTQTMGDDGNCHYYNHDSVGTYVLLCNAGMYRFENGYVYDTHKTIDWLFYINQHMDIQNATTKKAINKRINLFGQTKYDNLVFFEKADKYRGE